MTWWIFFTTFVAVSVKLLWDLEGRRQISEKDFGGSKLTKKLKDKPQSKPDGKKGAFKLRMTT